MIKNIYIYFLNCISKQLSTPQAASSTCTIRESRPQENILFKKMPYFNLHFIRFTFHSNYKAQTLAIVPFEIVPQGRNISLDKHLEEEAWQRASPQKIFSQGFHCVKPAAASLVQTILFYWRPCLSVFVRNQCQTKTTRFLFPPSPITAKINPFTSIHCADCPFSVFSYWYSQVPKDFSQGEEKPPHAVLR